MITRRAEFFQGSREELPMLPGVLPFGMIYGVPALSAGIGAMLVAWRTPNVLLTRSSGMACFLLVQAPK